MHFTALVSNGSGGSNSNSHSLAIILNPPTCLVLVKDSVVFVAKDSRYKMAAPPPTWGSFFALVPGNERLKALARAWEGGG